MLSPCPWTTARSLPFSLPQHLPRVTSPLAEGNWEQERGMNLFARPGPDAGTLAPPVPGIAPNVGSLQPSSAL